MVGRENIGYIWNLPDVVQKVMPRPSPELCNILCSVRDSLDELVHLGAEKLCFSCANPRVRILSGVCAN